MCGLVGVAGKLTGTTDKIFKNLLVLDSLRGIDSTGLAAVDRNEDVRIVKQVGNPYDLFNLKTYDSTINRLNRVLIGHNRFATQGVVNRKNAHPFEFENIVGAHNGTLFNKHKLLDSNHFVVDSENLFYHIQHEGLDSLMEVIDGAWSLVWWDRDQSTLNFLRNKERPLWVAGSVDETLIAWASEPWMLDVAINRENIKFKEPLSTQTDMHYSFHIGADAVISKPKVRECEAKSANKPPFEWPSNNYRRNFPSGENQTVVKTSESPLPVVIPDAANTSVTPTGKVVVFSKKNRVIPQSSKKLSPSSNDLYEGRKNVLLEVLSEQVDKHGARYLVCFDPENRKTFIRLYLKATDKAGIMIDKEIEATIGKRYADEKEGVYYKVEHSSVKLHKVVDENAGKYFMDGRGKLVSSKAWSDEYSKGCAWCTATVFPQDANRFTVEGDILCPVCAEDVEVSKYVNMR